VGGGFFGFWGVVFFLFVTLQNGERKTSSAIAGSVMTKTQRLRLMGEVGFCYERSGKGGAKGNRGGGTC